MNDHLFLVGSEEGAIYKCSKAYTSHFLDIYQVTPHYNINCLLGVLQLFYWLRPITWQFMPFAGIHFTLMCLHLVVLTGQLRYGTTIESMATATYCCCLLTILFLQGAYVHL